MANSQNYLVAPNPLPLSATAPSFVSNWLDKRSAIAAGLSLVVYAINGDTPTGIAWLELSNAPDAPGAGLMPANNADDVFIASGSQQNLSFLATGAFAATGPVGYYGVYTGVVSGVATGTVQIPLGMSLDQNTWGLHMKVTDEPAHWVRLRATLGPAIPNSSVPAGVTGPVATGAPNAFASRPISTGIASGSPTGICSANVYANVPFESV